MALRAVLKLVLASGSISRDVIGGCIVIIASKTPYHKHVAVRLSRVPAAEAAIYQSRSERIHQRAAAG
jgi:hypothetical protein